MQSRYGCIYRFFKKIDNKSYIGRTTNYEYRMGEHLKAKTNSDLSKDIKLLGKEYFGHEKLYDRIPEWMLADLEIKTIKTLDTWRGFGYNMNPGGKGFASGINNPNTNKFILSDIKEISDRYINGESSNQISKDYNVCGSVIRAHLVSYGTKIRDRTDAIQFTNTRPDVTKQQNIICQKYLDGESARKLGFLYNCDSSVIRRILKNNKIRIRTSKEQKQLQCS